MRSDDAGVRWLACNVMMRTFFLSGPVAQLGARFHGMEEVKGSNPFRSTKFLKDLAALVAFVAVTGVQIESKSGRRAPARSCLPPITPKGA